MNFESGIHEKETTLILPYTTQGKKYMSYGLRGLSKRDDYLYNHEHLNLNPQHPHNKASIAVNTYITTSRWGWIITEAYWLLA